MIEVRLIEDQRRLFCVEDTDFSFPSMTVPVKAGTVGAIVSLEPGTVVDWWASEGIKVHENTVIKHSYITADTGNIEPYAVILNSYVVCGDLMVRSYLNEQSSLRNCFIVTMENFHLYMSQLSAVQIGDSCGIVLMNSEIAESRITGNVNCIASEISYFYSRGSSANLSFFGDMMKQVGISAPNLNIVRSKVMHVELADGASNFLAQSSTVSNCNLNADFVLSGSVLDSCNVKGTMFHCVNVKLVLADVKSESPHVLAVNVTEVHETLTDLPLNFTIMLGDHPDTVVA